jgi:DNA-binding winged helix-turn-helix (wHTH) protein/tetratricopeptide (TPR) repeat protein
MTSGVTRLEGRAVKYHFGEYELRPNQGSLWQAGVRVPLMPKPLATLLVLVERAGETVSKDELLAQVWHGTAVEENNLTQCISTLRKVLGEKRGENRFIVTDPGNGYRFVAPVTRTEDVPVEAPESAISLVPNGTVHHSDAVPSRRMLFAFAAIALLCLVAAGVWLWTRHSAVQAVGRKSVAVLRIRDLSKSSSEVWLQTALSEMLTSELASGGKLHAIPAEDVVRWRSDLGTASESARYADLLRLARSNFGADTFVIGSYVVTGACPECRVRVDLGLYDAATGDRLATIIDEGPEQNLLDLTTRLGGKLRAELGVVGTPAGPQPWPAPGAAREYAEGLKALRRIDPIAARDHLQAAVTADPGNALIHSALADAWTALGYGLRANEESRRAYELSTSLGRLDQLGIEARYRMSAHEWDRAIEIYRSIFRLFPDSLEDGLNLARAQSRAMKIADTSATLSILRRLPQPAGNDPRIDVIEAQNAGAARDYLKTRDYARRAAEEAKARGAQYMFARARLLEGGAMQTMQDPNYYAVQTEGRKVCESIGDRQCVSMAWRIRGNERFFAGHFAEAQEAYLEGLSVARELGDRAELANLLQGLSVVAESNLEWDHAEQNLIEAISIKKETGYDPSEVRVQLAELYLRLGRLSDAASTADEALSEAQKTNAREDIGEVYLLQASLARLHGRLDTAKELGEKAIAEVRASNSNGLLTLALAALSSTLTARGDLDNAEKRLAEGKATDYPEGLGRVELARAELLLAKGQFQLAAEEAKRSAEDFSKAHLDENSALALVTEANALEMLGRTSDALETCRQAETRAARTPDPRANTLARLAAWRLSDSGSNVPADLEAKVVDLRNPELSLEEDFDRALRAKRTGTANARALFRALADQAAARGYLTMARRAHSLERSTAPGASGLLGQHLVDELHGH